MAGSASVTGSTLAAMPVTATTGSPAVALHPPGEGTPYLGLPECSATWSALADLLSWASVNPAIQAALIAQLGGTPTVPDLGYLSDIDITELLTLKLPGAAEGHTRSVILSERSTTRKAWLAARFLSGFTPTDTLGSDSAPLPHAPAPKRVKVSNLVGVTADADLDPISPGVGPSSSEHCGPARSELTTAFIGPRTEHPITAERHVSSEAPQHSRSSLPSQVSYKLLMSLSHLESSFNPSTGDWSKRAPTGPPDGASGPWPGHGTGLQHPFTVLECTPLLFNASKAKQLRNHLIRLGQLRVLYGPQRLPIICQHGLQAPKARIHVGHWHFERICRLLESHTSHYLTMGVPLLFGFNFYPLDPWDGVFFTALRDEAFFTTEAKTNCVLFLARLSPTPFGPPLDLKGSDVGEVPAPGPSSDHEPMVNRQGQIVWHDRRIVARAALQQRKTTARKVVAYADQICDKYSRGACVTRCPWGRQHVCSKCNGHHPCSACVAGTSSK
jgi:hypothetical protein